MTMKSKAQRRKFAELLVEGKITPEAYERWNKETGRKELPERVTPKKKTKKTTRATRPKRTTKARRQRGRARPTPRPAR